MRTCDELAGPIVENARCIEGGAGSVPNALGCSIPMGQRLRRRPYGEYPMVFLGNEGSELG